MAIKIDRVSQVLRSISGISTPVFGLSWNPPKNERESIRQLMIFLEDRRVLYTFYYPERTHSLLHISSSVLEIRTELTKCIQDVSENSKATPLLRSMRAACRKFLHASEGEIIEFMNGNSNILTGDTKSPDRNTQIRILLDSPTTRIFTNLGELRGVFGINLAQLCVMYGIGLEGDINRIFPDLDTSNEKDD